LLRIIADRADSRVSPAVCGILDVLARQYGAIGAEIASIDKSLMALPCEASRRLAEIPGIGPVGATALVDGLALRPLPPAKVTFAVFMAVSRFLKYALPV
jgi:transposase